MERVTHEMIATAANALLVAEGVDPVKVDRETWMAACRRVRAVLLSVEVQ